MKMEEKAGTSSSSNSSLFTRVMVPMYIIINNMIDKMNMYKILPKEARMATRME